MTVYIKDNNEGTKIRNTQCTLSFARRCFTVGEALSDLNFNKTTSKKEYTPFRVANVVTKECCH